IVDQPSSVLEFTMVGYQTVRINGSSGQTHSVTLLPTTTDLDEVVVVGYGTQRKGDLTGSIAQFNLSDTHNQLPNVSIVQSLQGALPGLKVRRATRPGQDASMSVRGINSLSSDAESNAPLIVVDGMIFRGSLVDISPNDIATVTVLKDASSAAIYGAQSS